MSSERGSSAMDRKEIQLCLENGSVKIKGYPNLSVSTEDPQLKASDLYEAIFKDIEKPTEVIVTPERDIDSNPVAKAICQSIKTIVDEAMASINPSIAKWRRGLDADLPDGSDADGKD